MHAVHHGGTREPWQALRPYRVFVNCSTSEVLCTATAEALAMRKWVILPRHPSNDCFAQFANCLLYDDDASFRACWQRACAHEPSADPKVAAQFSWAAATRRLTRLLARPAHQPWRDPPPYRDLSHGERRLVRRWLAQATPEGR